MFLVRIVLCMTAVIFAVDHWHPASVTAEETEEMDIQPFKIQIPESVLEDLQARLERTRFPEEITNSEWDYGTNRAWLKQLVKYWQTDYD